MKEEDLETCLQEDINKAKKAIRISAKGGRHSALIYTHKNTYDRVKEYFEIHEYVVWKQSYCSMWIKW